MDKYVYNKLLDSFFCIDGVNSNGDLLKWIKNENQKTKASLQRTVFNKDTFWFYDNSESLVRNKNNSFFIIRGIKRDDFEQPIILQNEVGYLGFIGKIINGKLHFLMQAKIEPGNVNKVQISPTIQATKSNFTQKHGGRVPYYLNYFTDTDKYIVIYDGEEPEQCSRFLRKYNRNVIILLKEDVYPHLDSFRWMTIGQIKYLANNYDNLVNMDTRTVMSCIPYDLADDCKTNTPLLKSIFGEDQSEKCLSTIVKEQKKIKKPYLIRLDQLREWTLDSSGIYCKKNYPFHFEFFDIEIEGREVTHWIQPLAVANGKALFVLAYVIRNGTMLFFIKLHNEIGCDHGLCFGPTIQFEAPYYDEMFTNEIEKQILDNIKNNKTMVNTTLSEEGGRFYCEENRNIICEVKTNLSIESIQKMGYLVVTYKTIRKLIEKSHMVNIQLRNLLSLLVDDYEKN